MRFTQLGIAFSCIACLAGCAGIQRQVVTDSVYVANGILLTLPAPSEIDPEIYAIQTLSGRFEDESFELQLRLEWRRDAIVVAAFSHFGNTLFSMSYDGHTITTVGNGLVLRGIDTSYVLADILLTFGDIRLLQNRLSGAGFSFVDEPDRRAVFRNGTAIIEIEYQNGARWNGRVHYSHLERGYEYEIETVQVNVI